MNKKIINKNYLQGGSPAQAGFAPLILLVVLLVLVALAVVGSYSVLKKAGKDIAIPESITSIFKPAVKDEVEMAKEDLTGGDDLDDIEADLEATLVGDLEDDFADLDSSAASL